MGGSAKVNCSFVMANVRDERSEAQGHFLVVELALMNPPSSVYPPSD